MAIFNGTDGRDTPPAFDTDDNYRGGGGDDLIRGGAGDDVLSGGQGNDTISGGQGNDKIYGGKGNDIINGGKGDDTADYTGLKSDYTFSIDRLGRVHLTDNRANGDGSDILMNVEHFHFGDGATYDLVNGQLVRNNDFHGGYGGGSNHYGDTFSA